MLWLTKTIFWLLNYQWIRLILLTENLKVIVFNKRVITIVVHVIKELNWDTKKSCKFRITYEYWGLCEINNIIKDNVSNYDKRFEVYKSVCNWRLLFDNNVSIDGKPEVMYRISVLRRNVMKILKNKINY